MRVTDCSEDGTKRGQISTRKGAHAPPAKFFPVRFDKSNPRIHQKFGKEVDQGKISAESKNGALTITLPMAEKTKPKQIKVKLS